MIYLYTSKNRINRKYIDIWSVDSSFNSVMSRKKLDNRDLEIMKEIEGLEPIKNSLLFKSNLGVTDIRHISTGLKTVLLIRYLNKYHSDKSYCINITECGTNVLNYVFEEASKNPNIFLVLKHVMVLGLKDKEIKINNSRVVRTSRTLLSALTEES